MISYYKSKEVPRFSLQKAFDMHLRFQEIHPFQNGNGRVGRLLLNKILFAHNLLPMIVYSTNRQSYFTAIDSASSGHTKKYYTSMLEQYKKTLDLF